MVGRQVAEMQGLERGMTSASTLHLFTDLYGWLAHLPVIVFMDEFLYPVARFGLERLTAGGIPILSYRHLDANDLELSIRDRIAARRIPIVLTDGWCPQCGRAAPIGDIAALLDRYGGLLILDDTQAFGLLGDPAAGGNGPDAPPCAYGRGGGGLLRWSGVLPGRTVTITSLAKSLGVPMAVISGATPFIREFRINSRTNDHCSPPSIAHLSAALHALEVNRKEGDRRRERLIANLRLFKHILAGAGMRSKGGLFPVQHLDGFPRESLPELYRALRREGILTVITRGHHSNEPELTMLFRAGHRAGEIRQLAEMIVGYYSKKIISHGNNP
jgi:8-amino-7-oxononanoate synthase